MTDSAVPDIPRSVSALSPFRHPFTTAARLSFIHTALLTGLGAIAIPIILHLLNRRTAKTLDWGAMRFLLESIESRRRRIELEEALLMACRCLLFGLLALAVARPFSPPGSQIPWVAVLPAFLLGLVAVSSAVILRASRRMFWWLLLTGLALFAYCAASVMYERYLNQKRFGTTGKKDIAFIIDASTSMQLRSGKAGSNFELAVAEAREIVEKTGGGSAFSLVLGGPVPMPRIPVPVVNKNDIYEALADAEVMQVVRSVAETHEQVFKSGHIKTDFVMLTLYGLIRQTLERLEEIIEETPALRQAFEKNNEWRKEETC